MRDCHAKEAAKLFKELLDNLMSSRYVEKRSSDKLLNMLPPKSKIRELLEAFFALARQSMSVVKAGSMANAVRTNDAKTGLSAFAEKLTAFGQEDGATSDAFDLKSAEKFVADMGLKRSTPCPQALLATRR